MPQKPSQQAYHAGETLQARVTDKQRPLLDAYFVALKEGTFQPVTPRFAATVMLVRPSVPETQTRYHSTKPVDQRVAPPNDLEVFMLRRQKTMKFVPDAVVFPGGRVDDKDSNADLPWAGPSPQEWSQRINRPEDIARRILAAAVREVFEESGILLAGPDADHIVADVSRPDWMEDRRKLIEHEQSLAELLIRRNLVIRTDLLNYCSNWCTPEYSPLRYDTFFFAARCPEGQMADDLSREAYIADWVEPQWAFDLGDEGTINLMPPTIYNIGFVARAANLSELMTTVHKPVQIMEKPAILENGDYVVTGILP